MVVFLLNSSMQFQVFSNLANNVLLHVRLWVWTMHCNYFIGTGEYKFPP